MTLLAAIETTSNDTYIFRQGFDQFAVCQVRYTQLVDDLAFHLFLAAHLSYSLLVTLTWRQVNKQSLNLSRDCNNCCVASRHAWLHNDLLIWYRSVCAVMQSVALLGKTGGGNWGGGAGGGGADSLIIVW